jgi:hypothetical protein
MANRRFNRSTTATWQQESTNYAFAPQKSGVAHVSEGSKPVFASHTPMSPPARSGHRGAAHFAGSPLVSAFARWASSDARNRRRITRHRSQLARHEVGAAGIGRRVRAARALRLQCTGESSGSAPVRTRCRCRGGAKGRWCAAGRASSVASGPATAEALRERTEPAAQPCSRFLGFPPVALPPTPRRDG